MENWIKIPRPLMGWPPARQQIYLWLLGRGRERIAADAEAIACALLCSVSKVCHELAALEREGAIRIEGGRIVLQPFEGQSVAQPPPPPQPPAQQMQLQLPAVAVGYPQAVAEVVEASRMPQFAGKRPLTEQEAQEFLDYYQAIGWMQRDGVPIRNWRLKIRKWTENRSTNGNGGKHNQDDNWRGTKRVGHGADFQSTAITGADDF